MLVTGVLYYFLLSDKNLEKRLNYYLDIEEKYKNIRDNKVKAGKDKNLLRRLNEIACSRLVFTHCSLQCPVF
jgi:hypothetical protein